MGPVPQRRAFPAAAPSAPKRHMQPDHAVLTHQTQDTTTQWVCGSKVGRCFSMIWLMGFVHNKSLLYPFSFWILYTLGKEEHGVSALKFTNCSKVKSRLSGFSSPPTRTLIHQVEEVNELTN